MREYMAKHMFEDIFKELDIMLNSEDKTERELSYSEITDLLGWLAYDFTDNDGLSGWNFQALYWRDKFRYGKNQNN